jgi:hypothetical protein
MAAPLRIEKKATYLNQPGAKSQAIPGQENQEFKEYLGRLLKLIPGEIVGLYMAGSGYIDPATKKEILLGWTIICFILLIIVRIIGTSDKAKNLHPQVPSIIISAVAFVIWIFWMGGVFKAYGYDDQTLASLAVLLWTFIVPLFYKGS